jgi:hypothetical protein
VVETGEIAVNIQFWAVRHVPSGGYLPEPVGRMGRGGSHVEPSTTERPRLFMSRRAAVNGLSAWLRGKVHHSSGYDSYAGEYYENTSLEPVPSRKRDEMEIIEVQLVLP